MWSLYSLNSALKIAEITLEKIFSGYFEGDKTTTLLGKDKERCIEKLEFFGDCLKRPVYRNAHTESTGTEAGGAFGAPGVTHSRNHLTEANKAEYLDCWEREISRYSDCYTKQREGDFEYTINEEVKKAKTWVQLLVISVINAAVIAVEGANTQYTLGPSDVYDQYWYTQAIFLNMQKFQLWSGNAFDTMNDNVNSQIGVSRLVFPRLPFA